LPANLKFQLWSLITMFVLVTRTAAGPRAEVRDAGNLRQLHVEFRQVDDEAGVSALAGAGLGGIADDHAWLDIAALRQAGEDTQDWRDQFEAMLGYARRNDWMDATGERVRAHIVRTRQEEEPGT
jgi:hypothetical protein